MTSFGDLEVGSLRTDITAYAALSFGASISGCILILTPSRDFVQSVALHKVEGRRHSSYSDLLFVFTFSGIAQLLTIGVVMAMYGLGGSTKILPDDAIPTHHALFLGAATVVIYSLFRLVVVVTTLSQIGVVIESAALQTAAEEDDANGPDASSP